MLVKYNTSAFHGETISTLHCFKSTLITKFYMDTVIDNKDRLVQ